MFSLKRTSRLLVNRYRQASKQLHVRGLAGSVEKEENAEMSYLKALVPYSHCLKDITLPQNHPLHNIAISISRNLKNVGASASVTEIMTTVQRLVNKEKLNIIPRNVDAGIVISKGDDLLTQTALRVLLLDCYLSKLQKNIQSHEINVEVLKDTEEVTRLCDAFLRGSATDRLASHLRLYGAKLSPFQLQSALYDLLGAELDVYTLWLKASTPALMDKTSTLTPKWFEKHKKRLDTYLKTYLLDTLDLNMLSRCVFAWSDPDYRGFQPVEESASAETERLLLSRSQYLPEANGTSSLFINHFIAERQKFHNERKEFRKYTKMGIVFFFGICVLDYVVCTM